MSEALLKLSIDEQLEIFKKGFPEVNLIAPCTIGNGIKRLDSFEEEKYYTGYNKFLREYEVVKFVPASGAASRMFKDLLNLKNTVKYPTIDSIRTSDIENNEKLVDLFSNLDKLPFIKKIKKALGKDAKLKKINDDTDLSPIINAILDEDKLDYNNKPKALIPFHRYGKVTRTPLYEHIQEAKEYVLKNGIVNIHFTVSPEHQKVIQKRLNKFTKREVIQLILTLSIQLAETDTVTVDLDNKPVIDDRGNYLRRPGGHGALIYNLNEIDADAVFIKNIDNVLPAPYSSDANEFKKIMGGYFSYLQTQLFIFAAALDDESHNRALNKEIIKFFKNEFNIKLSNNDDLKKYVNRPLRVCAMVKNEGQPGGGPYFVERNGEVSMQIVESAQINKEDAKQVKIMNKSTHFNPVDMICGLKDYKGRNFNLLDFVDKEMVFITKKSYKGEPIKALELPGLWNGAMADWNTAFIEMPEEYFNPVKTIFDLLDEKRIVK